MTSAFNDVQSSRAVFSLFDQQGLGMISCSELGCALRCLNFAPTEAQVSQILNASDHDGSGVLSFHEFVAIIEQYSKSLPRPPSDVLALFAPFDLERTGKIKAKYLAQLLTQYGEPLSIDDAASFLGELAIDGDGFVSLHAIIQHCNRTSGLDETMLNAAPLQ